EAGRQIDSPWANSRSWSRRTEAADWIGSAPSRPDVARLAWYPSGHTGTNVRSWIDPLIGVLNRGCGRAYQVRILRAAGKRTRTRTRWIAAMEVRCQERPTLNQENGGQTPTPERGFETISTKRQSEYGSSQPAVTARSVHGPVVDVLVKVV